MNWVVKYRDADGVQKEIVQEAENRASLFRELSGRGISPISVSEYKGKTRRDAKRSSSGGSSGFFKGIIALFIVVSIALTAWFIIRGGAISEEGANNGVGGGAPNGQGVKGDGGIAQAGASAVVEAIGADRTGQGETGESEATDNRDREQYADDGEEGEAPGEEEAPKKKKRVFEHGSDQLIAMATSAPEGGLIPPLPMISPAETDEFIESLSKPIEIEEDDSEAVKKAKERVQTVRGEIAKILAENPGKEIGDILNEHRDIFNENSAIRGEVEAELERIIEEGDIEGAKKYRDTMNYALQQMGISVIDTPITDEEREAAGESEEDGEEEQE